MNLATKLCFTGVCIGGICLGLSGLMQSAKIGKLQRRVEQLESTRRVEMITQDGKWLMFADVQKGADFGIMSTSTECQCGCVKPGCSCPKDEVFGQTYDEHCPELRK